MISYFLLVIPLLASVFVYIQICTYYQNDSIEFVRLEELDSPTVISGIEGENGLEW